MPRASASRRAAGETRTRAPRLARPAQRRSGGAAQRAVRRRSAWRPRARRPACRRRRGCDGAGCCFEFGSNPRQRRPDRHLAVELDQDLLDLAGLEDFDFDRALLRLDHGDDVAALDPIARLDQPLDQRARLHVGAERGHAEFDHGVLYARPSAALAAATILGTCGIAAFSRWRG